MLHTVFYISNWIACKKMCTGKCDCCTAFLTVKTSIIPEASLDNFLFKGGVYLFKFIICLKSYFLHYIYKMFQFVILVMICLEQYLANCAVHQVTVIQKYYCRIYVCS